MYILQNAHILTACVNRLPAIENEQCRGFVSTDLPTDHPFVPVPVRRISSYASKYIRLTQNACCTLHECNMWVSEQHVSVGWLKRLLDRSMMRIMKWYVYYSYTRILQLLIIIIALCIGRWPRNTSHTTCAVNADVAVVSEHRFAITFSSHSMYAFARLRSTFPPHNQPVGCCDVGGNAFRFNVPGVMG